MSGKLPLDPKLVGLLLQANGPWSAEDLATRLQVSRPTVQRALKAFGPQIVKLGVTRKTRYAFRRSIIGKQRSFSIYRLDEVGRKAFAWAELTALHGGWHLAWASEGLRPEWANQVHDHAGFCEGLPFFLNDLRPQGYLGRSVVKQLPAGAGLPSDIGLWGDEHVINYLIHFGHDMPGNLVLGDEATDSAILGSSAAAITPKDRSHHYPAMAADATAGTPVGSSVEGAQPKFTTWLKDDVLGEAEAVIVKFTDRLDTPTGRRWADLLAAEKIAQDIVTATTMADAESPRSEVLDAGGRRFYQITRFDRVGRQGRRGIVSLRSLHNAGFTGDGTTDWHVAAAGLFANGWISAADLRAVRLRKAFGDLIGNTDMHFGNLAFFLEDRLPLRLAPLYDMVPMLWAPRPGEGQPNPEFTPKPPLPRDSDIWLDAAKLAENFWARVEASPRVSEPFRLIAARAGSAIKTLRSRFD
jgi:hypothetical protein